MDVSAVVVLLLGSLFCFPATTTWGFVPSLTSQRISNNNNQHGIVNFPSPSNSNNGNNNNNMAVAVVDTTGTTSSTALFMAKLWDRMEIEEDEEPMWYVLNCVAGLEIDLLRMCRQRCEGMEDIEKFVVPMVTTTRSHGANRMVKDTKVRYQGYVFAKLRLCPETYEAIQGLDLCRSWMGTVNQKGHKKLPPAPVALNEDEIENFGLEELEAEEPEEPDGDEDIILDSEEADKEAADMEETVQKVYKGLRVDDMVKVTAKNKFFDEDAVVRRLKDGKLFLRFYTYGTMYEEWMDPGDVRKLTSIEILKGLSGPQQPITQQDIDGPSQGDRMRGGFDDQGPRDRRNLQGAFGGGGPRNRRQDSNAARVQQDSNFDRQRNDENWNWYKDNERRNQGGGYDDGNDIEIRGSSRNNNQRGDRSDAGWAQGDVDSQWGRTTQRENRREKRRDSNDADGDWSAFVSPVKDKPSQDETDDFFASLMTDLSNDLDSDSGSKGTSNRKSDSGGLSSGEDDFFASLISEIEGDAPSSSQSKSRQSSDSGEDDFFASLAEEIQNVPKQQPPKPPVRQTKRSSSVDVTPALSSTEDDFFAALAKEIGAPEQEPKSKATEKAREVADLDDFFAGLAAFDDDSSSGKSEPSGSGGESDDFFASLEAELETQLSIESPPKENSNSVDAEGAEIDNFLSELGGGSEPVKKSTPNKSKAPAGGEAPTKSVDVSSLDKCTVPALKEMLREKGLKVSGKKSELIERLASHA